MRDYKSRIVFTEMTDGGFLKEPSSNTNVPFKPVPLVRLTFFRKYFLALTDLDMKEEGSGHRVSIRVTLQSHIFSFNDGSLGQNLQADLLWRI